VVKLRGPWRACEKYQRETLVGLRCRRIQCDEIWSFVYAKAMKAEGKGWRRVDLDRWIQIPS
jgi:hypothetical protein